MEQLRQEREVFNQRQEREVFNQRKEQESSADARDITTSILEHSQRI